MMTTRHVARATQGREKRNKDKVKRKISSKKKYNSNRTNNNNKKRTVDKATTTGQTKKHDYRQSTCVWGVEEISDSSAKTNGDATALEILASCSHSRDNNCGKPQVASQINSKTSEASEARLTWEHLQQQNVAQKSLSINNEDASVVARQPTKYNTHAAIHSNLSSSSSSSTQLPSLPTKPKADSMDSLLYAAAAAAATTNSPPHFFIDMSNQSSQVSSDEPSSSDSTVVLPTTKPLTTAHATSSSPPPSHQHTMFSPPLPVVTPHDKPKHQHQHGQIHEQPTSPPFLFSDCPMLMRNVHKTRRVIEQLLFDLTSNKDVNDDDDDDDSVNHSQDHDQQHQSLFATLQPNSSILPKKRNDNDLVRFPPNNKEQSTIQQEINLANNDTVNRSVAPLLFTFNNCPILMRNVNKTKRIRNRGGERHAVNWVANNIDNGYQLHCDSSSNSATTIVPKTTITTTKAHGSDVTSASQTNQITAFHFSCPILYRNVRKVRTKSRRQYQKQHGTNIRNNDIITTQEENSIDTHQNDNDNDNDEDYIDNPTATDDDLQFDKPVSKRNKGKATTNKQQRQHPHNKAHPKKHHSKITHTHTTTKSRVTKSQRGPSHKNKQYNQIGIDKRYYERYILDGDGNDDDDDDDDVLNRNDGKNGYGSTFLVDTDDESTTSLHNKKSEFYSADLSSNQKYSHKHTKKKLLKRMSFVAIAKQKAKHTFKFTKPILLRNVNKKRDIKNDMNTTSMSSQKKRRALKLQRLLLKQSKQKQIMLKRRQSSSNTMLMDSLGRLPCSPTKQLQAKFKSVSNKSSLKSVSSSGSTKERESQKRCNQKSRIYSNSSENEYKPANPIKSSLNKHPRWTSKKSSGNKKSTKSMSSMTMTSLDDDDVNNDDDTSIGICGSTLPIPNQNDFVCSVGIVVTPDMEQRRKVVRFLPFESKKRLFKKLRKREKPQQTDRDKISFEVDNVVPSSVVTPPIQLSLSSEEKHKVAKSLPFAAKKKLFKSLRKVSRPNKDQSVLHDSKSYTKNNNDDDQGETKKICFGARKKLFFSVTVTEVNDDDDGGADETDQLHTSTSADAKDQSEIFKNEQSLPRVETLESQTDNSRSCTESPSPLIDEDNDPTEDDLIHHDNTVRSSRGVTTLNKAFCKKGFGCPIKTSKSIAKLIIKRNSTRTKLPKDRDGQLSINIKSVKNNNTMSVGEKKNSSNSVSRVNCDECSCSSNENGATANIGTKLMTKVNKKRVNLASKDGNYLSTQCYHDSINWNRQLGTEELLNLRQMRGESRQIQKPRNNKNNYGGDDGCSNATDVDAAGDYYGDGDGDFLNAPVHQLGTEALFKLRRNHADQKSPAKQTSRMTQYVSVKPNNDPCTSPNTMRCSSLVEEVLTGNIEASNNDSKINKNMTSPERQVLNLTTQEDLSQRARRTSANQVLPQHVGWFPNNESDCTQEKMVDPAVLPYNLVTQPQTPRKLQSEQVYVRGSINLPPKNGPTNTQVHTGPISNISHGSSNNNDGVAGDYTSTPIQQTMVSPRWSHYVRTGNESISCNLRRGSHGNIFQDGMRSHPQNRHGAPHCDRGCCFCCCCCNLGAAAETRCPNTPNNVAAILTNPPQINPSGPPQNCHAGHFVHHHPVYPNTGETSDVKQKSSKETGEAHNQNRFAKDCIVRQVDRAFHLVPYDTGHQYSKSTETTGNNEQGTQHKSWCHADGDDVGVAVVPSNNRNPSHFVSNSKSHSIDKEIDIMPPPHKRRNKNDLRCELFDEETPNSTNRDKRAVPGDGRQEYDQGTAEISIGALSVVNGKEARQHSSKMKVSHVRQQQDPSVAVRAAAAASTSTSTTCGKQRVFGGGSGDTESVTLSQVTTFQSVSSIASSSTRKSSAKKRAHRSSTTKSFLEQWSAPQSKKSLTQIPATKTRESNNINSCKGKREMLCIGHDNGKCNNDTETIQHRDEDGIGSFIPSDTSFASGLSWISKSSKQSNKSILEQFSVVKKPCLDSITTLKTTDYENSHGKKGETYRQQFAKRRQKPSNKALSTDGGKLIKNVKLNQTSHGVKNPPVRMTDGLDECTEVFQSPIRSAFPHLFSITKTDKKNVSNRHDENENDGSGDGDESSAGSLQLENSNFLCNPVL